MSKAVRCLTRCVLKALRVRWIVTRVAEFGARTAGPSAFVWRAVGSVDSPVQGLPTPFLPVLFIRKRTAVSEVDGCFPERRDALRACPGVFAVAVEHGA